MKYLPLVWAALWRRKPRTIFTMLSIVVAFREGAGGAFLVATAILVTVWAGAIAGVELAQQCRTSERVQANVEGDRDQAVEFSLAVSRTHRDQLEHACLECE
jgi:hypothetical protein